MLKEKEYKQKLKKLKSELNQSKENIENSNKNLKSIRDKASDLIEINERNIFYLDKNVKLINSFPVDTNSVETIDIEDTFHTATLFGEAMAKQSFSLLERSHNFEDSFNLMVSGTNVSSTSTDAAASAIFTLASEFSPVHQPTKKAIEEYNLPSTFDKKDELSNWFKSIDKTIDEKYNEAYKNYNDSKFMSACHALRDCLSHSLEKLAPDKEITECSWYQKPSYTSRPTQKQRIKYAIIGKTDENFLSEDDIEVLEKLMNEGREIYTKLSKEAHSRTGDWESKRTKSYFEITNNVLYTIKHLQEKL